jgi:hypothetical protein
MRLNIIANIKRKDGLNRRSADDDSISSTRESARLDGSPLIQSSRHSSKDNIFASFLERRNSNYIKSAIDADVQSASSTPNRIPLIITC